MTDGSAITLATTRHISAGAASPTSETARGGISALAACAGCLFSCRAIFVMISARWLNVGTEPGVLCGFGLSVALAIAAALGASGKVSSSSSRISGARPLWWVIAYVAFAGFSLFWSAAAAPATSALYWSSLATDLAVVVLLFRSSTSECAAHSLIKGFVVGTCILAAIAWIIPTEVDLRLGDLEYFNTNQIGNLCALAILMCTLLCSRGDGKWRFATAFLGITLFRSLSKATLIAFVASQIYRLLRDAAMSTRKKWILASSAVVLTLCFWGLLENYYDAYTTTGNQAQTLTGRTAIWAWTLDAGLTKPWFGSGFDAMWKVAPPFGIDQFEARHAENEILQQFFAYGACGIALLVGIYGSLYRRIRTLPRVSERTILISFLVFVLVRGLAEAEPFDLLLPVWLIATLAILVNQPHSAELNSHSQELFSSAAMSAASEVTK